MKVFLELELEGDGRRFRNHNVILLLTTSAIIPKKPSEGGIAISEWTKDAASDNSQSQANLALGHT